MIKIEVIQGDITKLKVDATQIAVETVWTFPMKNVKQVIFCCFGEDMLKIYQDVLKMMTPWTAWK